MPTRKGRAVIRIDPERCTGCGLCVPVCRAGCLEFSATLNAGGDLSVRYAGTGCLGDGSCLRACPEPGAMQMAPEPGASRPLPPVPAWAAEPA